MEPLATTESIADPEAPPVAVVVPLVFDGTPSKMPEVLQFSVGSAVVGLYEEMWLEVVRRHSDLRPVVFTTGSGYVSKTYQKHGHFCNGVWVREDGQMPEVFIAGERLHGGVDEVLETMLHEAAHAMAAIRGIADTSRGGRYHNKRFKKVAEEMGLNVESMKSRGLARTSFAAGTQVLYAALLRNLEDRIPAYRLFPVEKPAKEGSSKRRVKMHCTACPRTLSISQKEWRDGPIACGKCVAAFEPDDDPEADDN